ncbi:MAG: hypothetical protein J7647_22010 [Cyanobacteria bacterium SBLK]|nr:hypothetical protein [Cyanobacteria bacterium SBLK]
MSARDAEFDSAYPIALLANYLLVRVPSLGQHSLGKETSPGSHRNSPSLDLSYQFGAIAINTKGYR